MAPCQENEGLAETGARVAASQGDESEMMW